MFPLHAGLSVHLFFANLVRISVASSDMMCLLLRYSFLWMLQRVHACREHASHGWVLVEVWCDTRCIAGLPIFSASSSIVSRLGSSTRDDIAWSLNAKKFAASLVGSLEKRSSARYVSSVRTKCPSGMNSPEVRQVRGK